MTRAPAIHLNCFACWEDMVAPSKSTMREEAALAPTEKVTLRNANRLQLEDSLLSCSLRPSRAEVQRFLKSTHCCLLECSNHDRGCDRCDHLTVAKSQRKVEEACIHHTRKRMLTKAKRTNANHSVGPTMTPGFAVRRR